MFFNDVAVVLWFDRLRCLSSFMFGQLLLDFGYCSVLFGYFWLRFQYPFGLLDSMFVVDDYEPAEFTSRPKVLSRNTKGYDTRGDDYTRGSGGLRRPCVSVETRNTRDREEEGISLKTTKTSRKTTTSPVQKVGREEVMPTTTKTSSVPLAQSFPKTINSK